MVSFHKPEASRLSHSRPFPNVPPPEKCVSRAQFLHSEREKLVAAGNTNLVALIDEAARYVKALRPLIDIRWVDPRDASMFNWTPTPGKRPAGTRFWYKSRDPLPDTLSVHQSIAAYCSDTSMLVALMKAYGLMYTDIDFHPSLDHSMWFHAPFRADEWLLVDIEVQSFGNSRLLCRGHVYFEERLVFSYAQELLVRLRPVTSDVGKPRL
eukprot:TRINITY_DN30254_c0_g1_i1.p2 TRINITY_DN30254_c0_g1~~TRINITY_DN30254_c0_g1_i1.p2  ORF type:complete len:220 (+),score=68.67 TRINITY_DN30254_c0_g1_i1:31-660(+)